MEIDRLRQEIDQLQSKIDEFQRKQEMVSSDPSHGTLQDRGVLDPRNPWDGIQSGESGYDSQLVHVEMTGIEDKQKETLAQPELRLNRNLSELTSKKIEKPTSNKKIVEAKADCIDKWSQKKCVNQKKKGKGCKKKNVKKNCQKTCGLCDEGRSFLFRQCLMHFLMS